MMGERTDAAHASVLQTNINNVTGGASVRISDRAAADCEDLIRAGSFEVMIRLF